MKRKFKILYNSEDGKKDSGFTFRIVGQAPKDKPYVTIDFADHADVYSLCDKELELFARNILKSLNLK